MAPHPTVEVVDDQIVVGETTDPVRPPKKRRRVRTIVIAVVVALVVLVVAAVLWFFLGREQARQVDDTQAIEKFQQSGGGSSSAVEGLPDAGVYRATADGTESIGVPGMDEGLGPNAPVTVTHGDGGCFTYRVDFNSHHWRNWTFCPTADATYAVTGFQSWTYRSAPGISVDSLGTYVCETPIAYLWSGSVAGDTRSGSCTGTASDSDGVTADAQELEVLDRTTLEVDGQTVDVVHVRSTDTITDAQEGTEVDEWWLDASTGLPLKIVTDAKVKISGSDYEESATLTLLSLVPATS